VSRARAASARLAWEAEELALGRECRVQGPQERLDGAGRVSGHPRALRRACGAPVVKTLRVDIGSNSDFTSKGFGKRLRAMGGNYSLCRGYDSTRFLDVPNTPEGLDFAADAIRAFGHGLLLNRKEGTRIVLKPVTEGFGNRSSNMCVHYVREKDEPRARLDAILASFDRLCRQWWHEEGRAAAQRNAEFETQCKAERRAAMPGLIANMVQQALDLGCSRSELFAAVDAVLESKATS
jgi:hypothetical protein